MICLIYRCLYISFKQETCIGLQRQSIYRNMIHYSLFERCNVNIFSDKTWPQMYINIVDIYQWMTSMLVKAFVHHRHAVCFHLGNSNRKFFVSGKCYSFRNVALNAFINFWGSRCTCLGSNEIKYEWKVYLF